MYKKLIKKIKLASHIKSRFSAFLKFHTIYKIQYTKYTSGMTFIELTVVISIIGIMAGVIFFNYGTFTSGIAIQNTAQEIALSIETAQKYATSGQTFGIDTSNGYKPTYGVYFNLTDKTPFNGKDSANNPADPDKQFVIFNDLYPSDRIFDGIPCGGATTECIDNLVILSGDVISNICFDENTNPPGSCLPGNESANVTFQRPFPAALIMDSSGKTYGDMEIKIRSANNNDPSKQVIIWQTGQISVENVP